METIKKLLTIISALGMVSTASSSVVGCSNNSTTTVEEDRLEITNFSISIDDIENDHVKKALGESNYDKALKMFSAKTNNENPSLVFKIKPYDEKADINTGYILATGHDNDLITDLSSLQNNEKYLLSIQLKDKAVEPYYEILIITTIINKNQ